MAEYLDTNISPDDITVDNIFSYNKQTTDTINQIQFVDMANFTTEVEKLLNYQQNIFSSRHLKDTIENRPDAAEANTVFFIKE